MLDIVILSKEKIIITGAKVYNENEYRKKISCDILVILSNLDPCNFNISANIAVIYGDLGFNSYRNIRYKKIITYGMSHKNTVTISSVSDNEILMCTLREFESLNGTPIELKEYLLKKEMAKDLDCLALGVLKLILK